MRKIIDVYVSMEGFLARSLFLIVIEGLLFELIAVFGHPSGCSWNRLKNPEIHTIIFIIKIWNLSANKGFVRWSLQPNQRDGKYCGETKIFPLGFNWISKINNIFLAYPIWCFLPFPFRFDMVPNSLQCLHPPTSLSSHLQFIENTTHNLHNLSTIKNMNYLIWFSDFSQFSIFLRNNLQIYQSVMKNNVAMYRKILRKWATNRLLHSSSLWYQLLTIMGFFFQHL